MYVTDFEYANRRLSEFGFMIGHIDTNGGVMKIDTGCDITFKTVKNNRSSIHSRTSSTYDNVYVAEFEIVKNVAATNYKDMYITPLEVSMLMKWLNKRGYYKLKPFDQNMEGLDVSYYGSCNTEIISIAGNIVGLSITFTTNAPFGFADKVCLQYITSQYNENISVYGDGDDDSPIYPVITVTSLNDGDLMISNKTSGLSLCVHNCSRHETITLDCEHEIIVTDNEEHKKTLANDFNYEYLEILMDDFNCENIYEISMPCKITIEYSPIRKVGMY